MNFTDKIYIVQQRTKINKRHHHYTTSNPYEQRLGAATRYQEWHLDTEVDTLTDPRSEHTASVNLHRPHRDQPLRQNGFESR